MLKHVCGKEEGKIMKFSSTWNIRACLKEVFDCEELMYGSLVQVTGLAYETGLWPKVFVLTEEGTNNLNRMTC